MANRRQLKTTTPHAAVVIYNYKYRLGDSSVSEDQAHATDQLILNTVSLRSVTTSKSKSRPDGRFEIRLAPTKNWVNSITPGSWCVILMSQNRIFPNDTKYKNPKADYDKVKMVGRIESVRAVTAVDQVTGAITTEYIVQGEDWGGVLNTFLYVDPILRATGDKNDTIGAASRAIYNKNLIGYGSVDENKKGTILPSSSQTIKKLLEFWGRTIDETSDEGKSESSLKKEYLAATGRLTRTENNFRFPKELKDFLNLHTNKLSDLIKVVNGKLTKKDNLPGQPNDNWKHAYEEVDDGAAPIMYDTILGTNSFWQLIASNSNHWINDTYAEMRWELKPKTSKIVPNFTVYNRVKPFSLKTTDELQLEAQREAAKVKSNKTFNPKGISDFNSQFKYIRTHRIDNLDVILCNVGTNWRDRFNFIEVNIVSGTLAGSAGNENFSIEAKRTNQTFDNVAIGRDGFKPMVVNAKYIPRDNKSNGEKNLNPFRIMEYKLLNREWFFNIHRMFNGSMTLIGQSRYIAVGDNILVDAEVVFPGANANEAHIDNRGKAYVLAHVESVNHSATVNDKGARNFSTEIQFVRGIITDANGNELKTQRLTTDSNYLVDQDTTQVAPSQELNSNRVFGTSSGKDGGMDPDSQKLRGE